MLQHAIPEQAKFEMEKTCGSVDVIPIYALARFHDLQHAAAEQPLPRMHISQLPDVFSQHAVGNLLEKLPQPLVEIVERGSI